MRNLARIALSAAALCAVALALGRDAERAAPERERLAAAAAARGATQRGVPPEAGLVGRRAPAFASRPGRRPGGAQHATDGARSAPDALASRTTRSVAPILLDAPEVSGAAPVVRVRGFDPSGPRRVWLWRLTEGGAGLVARAESRSDGSFVFPRLVLPSRGLTLVAAPEGLPPDHPAASAAYRVEPVAPGPPRGVVLGDAGGIFHVRIHPALGAGDVIVADLQALEIGRYPLPRVADAARRTLELDVIPGPGEDGVLLGHEAPGGRRSAWRRLRLVPGTQQLLEEEESRYAE